MVDNNKATLAEMRDIDRFVEMIPMPIICLLAHMKGSNEGRTFTDAFVQGILTDVYPSTPSIKAYIAMMDEKPVLYGVFVNKLIERMTFAAHHTNYIDDPYTITFDDGNGPAWKLNLSGIAWTLNTGIPWQEAYPKAEVVAATT